MFLGSEAEAMRWADRAKALDPTHDRTSMVLVRFSRWTDVLAENDATDPALPAARVLAHIHIGDIDLARAAFEKLSGAEKSSPLGIMAQARLDEHDGKLNGAAHTLRLLASQQFENYDAEYLPPIPAIEALGGLYLRSGSLEDAIAAFREGLKHYPNDPRALYGLGVAYEKAGKSPESAQTSVAYLHQWESAVTTLSPDDI
jgi:tetratricopeptide (TPR) repeat protein